MASIGIGHYDYFASLPDEIVLIILDKLSTRDLCVIREVSTRFKRLSVDYSLWRYIDFKEGEFEESDLVNILPTTLGIWIEFPDILDNPTSTPLTIAQLNLRYLHLSGFSIPIVLLTALALISRCTHLRSIRLSCFGPTDEICGYIALNRSLQSLYIHVPGRLNHSGVLHILKNCQELKYFGLWDAPYYTPWDDVIDNLPSGLRSLEICSAPDQFYEGHIQKICKRFQNLEQLGLENYDSDITSTLACIGTHLKKLKRLRIFQGYIPLRDLDLLSQLSHLRHLYIVTDDEVYVKAVRNMLPQVEETEVFKPGRFFSNIRIDNTGFNARPGFLRRKWVQGDVK